MDPFKCTLQWGPNFSEKFGGYLGKADFSDVTLVSSDGRELFGHKLILASGSTFFKSLLESQNSFSLR